MDSLQQQVDRLIDRQKSGWPLAHKNYAELEHIRMKTLNFGRFTIQVQFNPERIRSTAAPDPGKTAKKPPCFLCPENRPPEQQAIFWGNYDILINPYPIFERHLTIPLRNHFPQQIRGKMGDMLRLAEALPDFVITFNGARSGASAPDHFHFQAVGKGELPAEKELPAWQESEVLAEDGNVIIRAIEHYLRPAFIVQGKEPDRLSQAAETVIRCFSTPEEEGQFNILAWNEAGDYTLVLFPRAAHRPKEFYAEGSEKVLFSPGVVDMAGVIITVRPEDFDKITLPLLQHLFEQVVPNDELWKKMKRQWSECRDRNRLFR